MKKLIILPFIMLAFAANAHYFTLTDGRMIWQKNFNGKPNETAIIINAKERLINGQLNNHLIDYQAQGIEWRYLPLMLNDPINANVSIDILTDSTYMVAVSNITFRITDRERGLIGQMAELEYYMISNCRLTRDPEMIDVLEIISKDFERIF